MWLPSLVTRRRRPLLIALTAASVIPVLASGPAPEPRDTAELDERATSSPPAALIAMAAPDPPRPRRCPGLGPRTSPAAMAAVPGAVGSIVDDVDVRRIAVWTEQAVHLSRDGGRTSLMVLAGDGAVRDAMFDCDGHLHALRGDGLLGTIDEGGESWRWVARFQAASRLMADIDGVAVIGVDPDDQAELLLARRDRRGRWRTVPLVGDHEYLSYDGIEVLGVESISPTRRRLLVRPWQGGECGTEAHLEVTVDLDRYRVRTETLGELPPRYR